MDNAGWYLLRRIFFKAGAGPKTAAGLLILLVVLLAYGLAARPAHAQSATATPGPYPTPVNPYPSPVTGQETATASPTTAPTLAASASPNIPSPTSQATAALPSPTLEPALTTPDAQNAQNLQANPQPSGRAPTYVPLPAITFELPDQSTAQSRSPTPIVVQQNSSAERWVPLAVIVVIWGLLAGWFYLSFRRLG